MTKYDLFIFPPSYANSYSYMCEHMSISWFGIIGKGKDKMASKSIIVVVINSDKYLVMNVEYVYLRTYI